MDKIVFSIAKTGLNSYILQDKVGSKTYKFDDFGEIIDAFSTTNHPSLPINNRVFAPSPQQGTVKIFQRIPQDNRRAVPKYFWSHPNNTFEPSAQMSVREVLKQIRKNMNGW